MFNHDRKTRRTIRGISTAVLATTVGLLAPLAAAPAAQADCQTNMSGTETLVAGTYYYDLTVNSCGTRQLFDDFGSTAGYAGAAGLVTSLVPGAVGRAISGAFGTVSTAQFFTQGAIQDCSEDFTKAIVITFVHGGFIGCETLERRGGGGDF